MVFESIVADLLNRFLGDYVQNLDRKQLKLGIWGGDVSLKNLDVKASALDDLDLPVQVICGHLGHLHLKIPWKNMYTSPVIATIEQLYVIVIPNLAVKYDAEKEEKAAEQAKFAELQRIEEAKAKEAQKKDAKEDKKDTFTEKLVTQIIKNLQVKIIDIHIRYEDTVTDRKNPFSFGFTLHNLSFETTDEKWIPTIIQENVNIIHKLVTLDSFSLYWNCNTTLFTNMSPEERQDQLKKAIATSSYRPLNVSYMLGPIYSTAQLRLNSKPETDSFKVPKVWLNVVMEEIAVGLAKFQYRDLMKLLEAFDRLTVATLYRKYRPQVQHEGHPREWWKFAITAVLEEDVRRKRLNWSWQHMQEHRNCCKHYKELYVLKLLGKKLSSEQTKGLCDCEKKLDLFNITVARKQAELEAQAKRQKHLRKSKTVDAKTQSWGGWVGSWFSSGPTEPSQDDESAGKKIIKQFEEAMTEQEKAKLYEAIGYQDQPVITEYPKEFVENKLLFVLRNLTLTLSDNTRSETQVLKANLTDVSATVEQRPSAQAMSLEAKMESFVVHGVPNVSYAVPTMVTSQESKQAHLPLLTIWFETNPLDGTCDNRLHVEAQPLEIIFHANTVNRLAEVFTPPEQVDLQQLQATAMIKLEEMKEMSAFGLQYAIEQHKYLDLKVDMKPAFIVIPETGEYSENVNLLVMSLGNFKMDSAKRDPNSPTVRSMVKAGSTEEEVMSTMMESAYDKYQIRIENAEIILAAPEDDWRKAVGCAESLCPEVSPLHLLRPVSLNVDLHKSIISVDPRMPVIRLAAELTSLTVSISDDQLFSLVKLGKSIPLPEVEAPLPAPKKSREMIKDAGSVNAKLINQAKKEAVETFKTASSDTDESDVGTDQLSIQKTDLELKFEVKEFAIFLSHHSGQIDSSMVKFSFHRFETILTMRTFDMSCDLYLGGILLEDSAYLTSDNLPVKLVSTSMNESTENLLTLKYLQANKKGPDFEKVYNSTLQFVMVDIRDINVVLHQEAIISLMEFSNTLAENMGSLDEATDVQSVTTSVSRDEEAKSLNEKIVAKKKKKATNIIDMELRASLNSICVTVCSIHHNLTDIKIKGMSTAVVMDKLKTSVSASLKDMVITDPSENALYPMILTTDAGEVLDVKFIMFNDATDDENYIDLYAVDMRISVGFGQIKIVFLNKFVASLLCFLDHFQTAKEKVAEASAVAAEAAKQGMEKVYEKATRIALDICIQAPVVIIPQNSSSKNTIIADLGIFKISNTFKFGNRRNELGIPAILDSIVMNLENLQLSRGLVNPKTNEIIAECVLLEPISFSVIVVRNLAPSWYTDEPEVDIFGKLEAICVSLSQEDYTTAMKILSENLAETQVQAKTSLPIQPVVTSHEDKSQKRVSIAVTGKAESKTSESYPQIKTKIFTRFNFNFELDKASLKFYTGATELTKTTNMHSPEQAMAEVQVQMITIGAKIMSDETMSANVFLENVTLNDTRISRIGITRLMDRILKEGAEKMIIVQFQQDRDGTKNLDVKVCSFSLVACLPYILKLAEFFGQTSDDSTPPIEGIPLEHKSTDLTSTTSQALSEQTASGHIIITVKIESPDIVLIEDIDDIDSNAIFLNNEISAKILLSDTSKVISGQITDLTFYTASFNPMKRTDTTVQILNPSRIDLQCNLKPTSQTIDLLVHDFVLQISPGTVDLITNILSALVTEKVPDAPVEEKVVQDYTDLWKPKSVASCNYWFLQKLTGGEKAIEATEEVEVTPDEDIEIITERMLFTLKKIILTIEAGKGRRTVPMLLMETSFQAQICDWSTELNIESTLGIEVSCYNEKIAVWEPLLEPVETAKGHRSWELYMEICKRSVLLDEELEEELPAPLKIEVRSDDIMELTVSKTCLETLTNLSEAFGEAVKRTDVTKDKHPYAPYRVYNELGIPINLIVDGMFQVLGTDDEYGIVILYSSCGPVHLTQVAEKDATTKRISMLKKQFTRDDTAFNIKISAENMNIERTISVACTNKRYFQLPRTTYPGEKWGFVVDIKSDTGSRVVTFQSNIQVNNHFSIPMDIYYMKCSDNEVVWCGTVDPHKILHLPLHAVYTKSSELFFKPQDRHQMYSLCGEPFLWKILLENPSARKILQCDCKTSDGHSFFMDVAGSAEHIFFEETMKKTVSSSLYTINLYPTVRLRNLLFHPIHFSLQGVDKDFELQCGESNELWSAETGKTGIEIRICKYLDRNWTCYRTLSSTIEELSVWTFAAELVDTTLTLELGMRTQHIDGSLVMELYSPYCMVNKTGLMLVYRRSKKGEKFEGRERKLSDVSECDEDEERQSSPSLKADEENNNVYHPPELEQPVMFSFRAKAFFSKKKVPIKVKDSEWTEKFSIDAVGSSGNVIAKSKSGRHYDIGVQIRLSHSSLTKMIIFTPFYILVNNCQFDIEVQEIAEFADWIKIKKDECTPFWPVDSSTAQMVVRYVDDNATSEAFSYNDNQHTLLKLHSKMGGIQVECTVAQSSIMLTFEDYVPGRAAALLVNHMSEYVMTYCQMGSKVELELPPYTCVLYSWENPMEKRILSWKCREKKDGTHDLVKDGVGDFSPESGVKAYWLSFLDGMQRVLIFTHDLNRAIAVESACQEVKMEQEIIVMLQGMGLSLVNNETKLEIMYMGITSTGVIWEGKKERSSRFKTLSLRECMVLETGYMRYQNELKIGRKPRAVHSLDAKIEVDFHEMKMLKPVVKNIRRSFQTGLWLEYKTSPSASYFHAKINRLQIDNQLADCVFPVVFAPVPPPKSVAAENAPKPFTELSVMLRREEKSSVMQIKYCKILIQEFHIKVDQSFINSMILFFTPDDPTEVDFAKLMALDKDVADSSLKDVAAVYSSQEQKCYYENLHFSPLKVHISFSNTGAASGDDKKPTAIHSDFLNLLLQSVGVTLTEIQDVIFKLDFFERKYVFMSTKQLINEATGHYTGQAVKQLYMLVLGLDVIGNPVGLILGIGEGVTDLFYEPFQGAIQGPEEFFEGLGLGVKSLFGHAIGGAAGAASRITGTLGKGLAALTLDDDYQKRRRQYLNRRPQDPGQRFAQGGKSLVMGVYEGVTGVVSKPMEGAREGGVGGFFKGVGKGLIGIVARPSAGAVDFVTGSFDSVKKLAEMHEEIKRLRPPRYIRSDGVIRPYVRKESEGNRLLQDVEKGKYSSTDIYEAHIAVGVDEKSFLLVTNNRIMYVTKGEVFGQWNTEWEYRWEQLKSVPTVTEDGIRILLKEPHKKKMNVFGSKVAGKLVHAHDIEQCKWIVSKIQDIMGKSS